MKHKIILLIIFTLALISCKKDEPLTGIEGTWELSASINGMSGQKTDYPIGNASLLVLKNNTYQNFTNGNLTKSGTFQIVKEKSLITGKLADMMLLDNQTNSIKTLITVVNNELSLSIDGYDAPTSTYRRLK